MRKTLVGILIWMLPLMLAAQAPAGYYDSAKGKNGAALKTALHNKIKGHTPRTYANLWTDFQSTDRRANGKVWDMYSNCTFDMPADQCGNYSNICDCYNREHSMPKSWFNDASPMYTDLFHLYPTDGKVNGYRSNYPFGETNGTTYGTSKLGTCTFPGYTGTVFEPANEYKGDFARTYFYMVTRYENVVTSWYSNSEARPTLNGTAYPAFQEWAMKLLLKWSRQDPVSEKEINRNNAVYNKQGNRNPFIDHPELVEYIWGDSIGKAWNSSSTPGPGPGTGVSPQLLAEADFVMYPNPAATELSLQLGDGIQLQKVEVIDMQGTLRYVQHDGSAKIDISNLKSDIYIVRIATSKGIGVQLLRVVK